jgi:hypothetical protein
VNTSGGECSHHCLCGGVWVYDRGVCQSCASAGGGYFAAGGDRVSDGFDVSVCVCWWTDNESDLGVPFCSVTGVRIRG